MNRPAHRTAAAALAASLLLVLAGCGDDDDNTAAQDPTSTPAGAGIIGGPSSAEGSGSSSASTDESASPSASADAEDDQAIEIELVNGKPTEKIGTVEVAEGDELTLVITSDEAQEIHIHGLDEYIEVPAGDTVTKTFTIDLAPGSYEVEVHDNDVVLFNLRVE